VIATVVAPLQLFIFMVHIKHPPYIYQAPTPNSHENSCTDALRAKVLSSKLNHLGKTGQSE